LNVRANFGRPSGTQFILHHNPALKRRAFVGRPGGTKNWRETKNNFPAASADRELIRTKPNNKTKDKLWH